MKIYDPTEPEKPVVVVPKAKKANAHKDIPTQVRDSAGAIVDPRKEIRMHFLEKYEREPTEAEFLEFYNANVQRDVFQ